GDGGGESAYRGGLPVPPPGPGGAPAVLPRLQAHAVEQAPPELPPLHYRDRPACPSARPAAVSGTPGHGTGHRRRDQRRDRPLAAGRDPRGPAAGRAP